jgi:hypothetical protein
MVDVVQEPHGDAALARSDKRTSHDRREWIRQAQVVDRDLERPLRRGDVVRENVCDPLRRLAAVGECVDLYCAAFARCSAL